MMDITTISTFNSERYRGKVIRESDALKIQEGKLPRNASSMRRDFEVFSFHGGKIQGRDLTFDQKRGY